MTEPKVRSMCTTRLGDHPDHELADGPQGPFSTSGSSEFGTDEASGEEAKPVPHRDPT